MTFVASCRSTVLTLPTCIHFRARARFAAVAMSQFSFLQRPRVMPPYVEALVGRS